MPNCGSLVLYDPDQANFVLSGSDDVFLCVNADQCDCNWRAPQGQGFCRACALNKTIPDLSIDGNRDRWTRVEAAKKRAIYSLLAYGLTVGAETRRVRRDRAGFRLPCRSGGNRRPVANMF